MPFAIVAYPNLDEEDRRWIETIRAKHVPQAARIEAHFTLVFPFDEKPADLEREVAGVASSTRRLDFDLRHIRVVPEGDEEPLYVFLVPGEGAAELVALHDRLYAGSLASHLRPDPAYIPHVTLAVASDRSEAEALARDLGDGFRPIRGSVVRIDLLELSPAGVRSIGTYPLGGPSHER